MTKLLGAFHELINRIFDKEISDLGKVLVVSMLAGIMPYSIFGLVSGSSNELMPLLFIGILIGANIGWILGFINFKITTGTISLISAFLLSLVECLLLTFCAWFLIAGFFDM